jgi:hypothetical protein
MHDGTGPENRDGSHGGEHHRRPHGNERHKRHADSASAIAYLQPNLSTKILQNAVIGVTKAVLGLFDGIVDLRKRKNPLGRINGPHIRSEGHSDFRLSRFDLG